MHCVIIVALVSLLYFKLVFSYSAIQPQVWNKTQFRNLYCFILIKYFPFFAAERSNPARNATHWRREPLREFAALSNDHMLKLLDWSDSSFGSVWRLAVLLQGPRVALVFFFFFFFFFFWSMTPITWQAAVDDEEQRPLLQDIFEAAVDGHHV